MKVCPTCQEAFEDEMKFCTFDGAVLRSAQARATAAARRYSQAAPANPWKIAFFTILAISLIGVGMVAFFSLTDEKQSVETSRSAPVAVEEKPGEDAKSTEAADELKSLAEMKREELLDILPKNLLRRFHAGESSQGRPDDFRVISSDKAEYVVLVGAGKPDRPSPLPAVRILALQYEENQFRDVTRQVLPPPYGAGVVTGAQAEVKIDATTPNLIVREPASSNAVVSECATCEHAYQQVTLEWKGTRYVESDRAWENDRYTAFYVVADALEKRKVDARARPFIEKSLDAAIAQGFARNGKEGWTAQARTAGDEAESASFELTNGTEILIVRLSKVKGQWKAVEIGDK